MGMVKRVLYTATWGSVRDPEAVSYCRNKTGDNDFLETSSPNRGMTFKTYCVWNHTKRNSPNVSANFLVFAPDAISLECLGSRAYFY